MPVIFEIIAGSSDRGTEADNQRQSEKTEEIIIAKKRSVKVYGMSGYK